MVLLEKYLKTLQMLYWIFFVKLFNEIFNKGVYPENWTDSIIHPLHKKGNPNDPNNYRGISLSDVSGKLFSTIINRRLQM